MTANEILEKTTNEELEKLLGEKKFDITVYEALKRLEKDLIIAGVKEENLHLKNLLEEREITVRSKLFTYARYRA